MKTRKNLLQELVTYKMFTFAVSCINSVNHETSKPQNLLVLDLNTSMLGKCSSLIDFANQIKYLNYPRLRVMLS